MRDVKMHKLIDSRITRLQLTNRMMLVPEGRRCKRRKHCMAYGVGEKQRRLGTKLQHLMCPRASAAPTTRKIRVLWATNCMPLDHGHTIRTCRRSWARPVTVARAPVPVAHCQWSYAGHGRRAGCRRCPARAARWPGALAQARTAVLKPRCIECTALGVLLYGCMW
jgi:hypothetical protein